MWIACLDFILFFGNVYWYMLLKNRKQVINYLKENNFSSKNLDVIFSLSMAPEIYSENSTA